MATPIAQPSINTFLQLGSGTSPETFSNVANMSDITGPTMSAAVVDVTSHSNPDPWRRKIVTLLDAGQVNTKIYFITNDPGHKALLKIFTSRSSSDTQTVGAATDWRIEFPDSTPTIWTFQAWLSKFSITSTVAGVTEAQITLEVVGPPTFPA